MLTFLLLCISWSTYAQSWSSYQTLFSNKDLQVEISFRHSTSACDSHGQSSRYKYRIKGKLAPNIQYLNWKMQYLDCNGIQYTETNSINIGKGGFAGIVESMDYTFRSKDSTITPFDIEVSNQGLKNKQEFKKVKTVLPEFIHGKRTAYPGESILLSAQGGTLGTGAEWEWYGNDCQGTLIGRGVSVKVQPSVNTTYYLKAVDDTSQTECISINVQIDQSTRMPLKILGNDYLCLGDSTELRIEDGILGDSTEWVWYEDICGAQEIGRGTSILVRPRQRTTYFLKADGINGSEFCIRKIVHVQTPSSSPLDIVMETSDHVCQGELVRLRVQGGQLGQGAHWAWYKNTIDNKNRLGTGELLSNKPQEDTKYIVRAEGYCNNTDAVSKFVSVTPQAADIRDIKFRGDHVFKKNRTVFYVDSRTEDFKNRNWFWTLDNCTSSTIGKGDSIVLKLKKPTTISIYNETPCGKSPCFSKTFTPVKGQDVHQKFSNGSLLQLSWEIGPHSIARSPIHSSKSVIFGIGGDIGFHFYPVFKKYYSIGLGANVASGTYLNYSMVEDKSTQPNYYLSFQPKIELAVGAKGAKILFSYANNMHTEKHKVTMDEVSSTIQHSYRQDLLTAGFRFGAVDRKNGIVFFDISYLRAKNQDWSWDHFNWKFQKGPKWKHGIAASISVHNTLKIDISTILKDENQYFHKNTYQLGVKYLFNRYY